MRDASTGREVHLGRELARGGEGAIHLVPSMPDTVAKIYASPPTPERAAKLWAMVAMPRSRLPVLLGWPRNLLEVGGTICGFTMPLITGRHELHATWSGASRRSLFPKADYAMLVATAANLARAVAGIHAAGLVIGDVNERCALVGADSTVALIDCDSFQVDAGDKLHTCDVATPMYQPPELQGVATYRGLHRSRNYDAFGLAVLIFQILFFARHPFAGRPISGEAPEIPQAIAAFQFAWAENQGLLRPPRTLPLSITGPAIETYFRRAFSPEGVNAGRPTAAAWARALDAFKASLRACSFNPAHQHLQDQARSGPEPDCPLCTLEGEAGGELFAIGAIRTRGAGNPEKDTASFWSAIMEITPPPAKPKVQEPGAYQLTGKPYPSDAGILARLLQNLGILESPVEKERAVRMAAVQQARTSYAKLVTDWSLLDPVAAFESKRNFLANVRQQLLKTFRDRNIDIASAGSRAELQHHLGSYALDGASIQGIGRKRLATLKAHGITTAADISINAMSSIPGIGPTLKEALKSWQKDCAANFRPLVGQPRLPPASDVRRIDAQYAPTIGKQLAILRQGADALQRVAVTEKATMDAALLRLAAAARALAQAEADLQGN